MTVYVKKKNWVFLVSQPTMDVALNFFFRHDVRYIVTCWDNEDMHGFVQFRDRVDLNLNRPCNGVFYSVSSDRTVVSRAVQEIKIRDYIERGELN